MRMAILMATCLVVGCTQAMDKELMNMRGEAAANEKLYGAAALSFADSADQMAGMKHALQQQVLAERTSAWVKEHTVDGVVTATPDEMNTMLAQRDAANAQLGKSIEVWGRAASDFRRMVADKMAFSATIYAKEEDAQAAREMKRSAEESLVKTLLGAASAASIAIPIMVP